MAETEIAKTDFQAKEPEKDSSGWPLDPLRAAQVEELRELRKRATAVDPSGKFACFCATCCWARGGCPAPAKTRRRAKAGT